MDINGTITLEEFHQDFLQSILVESESRGITKGQAFFENTCEEMVKIGELSPNYVESEYIKRGLEISGYDYDEERRVLSLIVYKFNQENSIETLKLEDIKSKFKNLKNILEKVRNGFYKDLEETSSSHDMAYKVYNLLLKKEVDRIKLILITDGRMTKTIQKLENETFESITVEHKIVDINYIYQVFMSEISKRTTDIDVSLPFLEVGTSSDKYKSYLLVLNGEDLYNIFDIHGQQLFEQNVRTFLQFKGGVNKGLKNTLEYKPEMFFAYNNGLTATALSVEVDKERITKINNFQIVNGAQTTSAIYAAKKNNKIDISNVMVQMKLSVVSNIDDSDDFVSKVSEYANSQNKINKSDFFSNSPFHKDMKTYSKKVYAPSINGAQRRTRWFYERARGEFLNEQLYLTKAQKNAFLLENPKSQFIDKTFLAKCENAWNRKPFVVAKGAQASFTFFAEMISKEIEKNDKLISEAYFKEAVSKIIFFRKTEKLVSAASWYANSYRAQIVAYTLSYVSEKISNDKKYLNFNLIWERQALPEKLCQYIEEVAEKINELIMSPEFQGKNIGQWFKKEEAWTRVKTIKLEKNKLSNSYLLDNETVTIMKREEVKDKKLDKEVDFMVFVYTISDEEWRVVFEYINKYRFDLKISTAQFDIITKFTNKSLLTPSSKQSKILHDLYSLAKKDGVL